MKWQRHKYAKNQPYHLPRGDMKCGQDWHYFQTLCRKEIKAPYGQWEIKEDPPETECCQMCLATQKEKKCNQRKDNKNPKRV